MVRLTDRPDMTLDVYRGRKTTMQQCKVYAEYRVGGEKDHGKGQARDKSCG